MINLEISNGEVEKLEDPEDTPRFNIIEKEYDKFQNKIVQEYQKFKIKQGGIDPKTIQNIDDIKDNYWDLADYVSQNYADQEHQYLVRMEEALSQDRQNSKRRKNPNLI